ncbi:hypothetical protein [Bacillus sp. FSL M8-0054]
MFTELENRFGVRHWRKEVQSLDELYSFVNFFNFDERFNNKLKNSIEFFDQYKNEEKLTRQIGINVNLSMQYGCSEVKQEVLGMLKPIEFRIKTGLEILEKLEQEHQEMNLLLDDFF